MSCTNTTAMYLNVSTDICASASASRSGNTITVSGTFSVTQGNAWNYNAIYAYVDGVTSWTKVKPYKTDGGGSWSASFSFSFDDPNAGSRSYNAIFQVFNNAETGTVGNPANVGFSISYPAGATAPTNLSLSNVSTTSDTVTGTVSVSSWGGTGNAQTRYRNLSVMATSDKSTSERRYQRVYGNTTSSAIVVNNNTQYGSMTIKPNTQYWLWWYATNGTYGTSSPDTSSTTVVTLPPAPSISILTVTSTSVQLSYSLPDQGGKYDMTLKYQLDGGSLVNIQTVSGSGTKAGTFTIDQLSPGTTHSVVVAVQTTAGEMTSNTLTFTTATSVASKLYGSVGGSAKEITKLYGPVKVLDNMTGYTIVQPMTDIPNSATAVNMATLTAFSKTYTQLVQAISEGREIEYALGNILRIGGGNYNFQIAYRMTDGTNVSFRSFSNSDFNALASTVFSNTGITLNPDAAQGALASSAIYPTTVDYTSVTKEIIKLYGSVNGETKLVYDSAI